jgi:hypothetical protein
MAGRQLVISITPTELEEINTDLELLGIEERYRSAFLREAIKHAIAIRKEGKVALALTEATILELAKVTTKPARQITRKVGK